MKCLIFISITFMLYSITAQSINAQSDILKPGSTVRVSSLLTDEGPIIGTIEELTEFDIAVNYRNRIIYIPYHTIEQLEVHTGIRRRTGRGALIGLGSGAVLGGLIGAITYTECVSEGWFDCMFTYDSRAESAGLNALLLGAVGGLTGAIIGATKKN
ncbi:hypothetical protein [Rhodohalobacter halophilus]|uniref:hypothetical protein n=1 Tax=Rhodohalobacter halophilus TaxID=1812810 RepID=UPI00114CD16E|nr:hypothetical protein [Rhodohalobacter halophilus]